VSAAPKRADALTSVIAEAKNLDAEQSVCGGVLLRNEVLALLPELEVDHFFDPKNRAVFSAIRQLEARRVAVDTLTLEHELRAMSKFDALPVGYIAELALRVPTPDNVVHYARVVMDHALTRRVLITCSRADELVRGGVTAGELLDEVIGELGRHAQPTREREVMTIESVTNAEIDRIMAWSRGEGEQADLPRLSWGIPSLDKATGGVPVGLMTALGARPGVGKTLTLSNFAWRTNEPGTLLSNEDDPKEDLAIGFIALVTRIDSRRLRDRELSADEFRQVDEAREQLRRGHVRLVSIAGWSWERIRRLIVFEKARRGIRWWGLDYLNNVPPDARDRNEKRTYQIQNIMQGGQTLCAEEQLAGIVCCQIGRSVDGDGREKASGKTRRPRMSDFKDSAAIDACSKLMIALHQNADKRAVYENQVEAVILKNRRGKTGRIVDLECIYEYGYLGELHAMPSVVSAAHPSEQQIAAVKSAQASLPASVTRSSAPPHWNHLHPADAED
jgi:replicative DNA helicase